MTTKEKIIHKSIGVIKRKISHLEIIITANPASELCSLHIQLAEMLEKNKTIEQRTSKEFMDKIKEMSSKENELMKMHGKQRDLVGLMDKQFELKRELNDLETELFFIERKKGI